MSASENKAKEIASQVAQLMSANASCFTGLEKAEFEDLDLQGAGGRGPAGVLLTFSDGSTYELLAKRWN